MLSTTVIPTVFQGLYYILLGYFYILIADVLLSWLPEIRRTRFGQLIHQIANPYMRLFRGWIVVGMFDFTPIIGFIIYQFGLNYFHIMVLQMPAQ